MYNRLLLYYQLCNVVDIYVLGYVVGGVGVVLLTLSNSCVRWSRRRSVLSSARWRRR